MSDRQNAKESQPPDEEGDSNRSESPKSYYYDDSTGYETYRPEGDTADEEDVGEDGPRSTEG